MRVSRRASARKRHARLNRQQEPWRTYAGLATGSSLCRAHAAQAAGIYGHRRLHAGAGHRREYGRLQLCECAAAAAAAVSRCGPARTHHGAPRSRGGALLDARTPGHARTGLRLREHRSLYSRRAVQLQRRRRARGVLRHAGDAGVFRGDGRPAAARHGLACRVRPRAEFRRRADARGLEAAFRRRPGGAGAQDHAGCRAVLYDLWRAAAEFQFSGQYAALPLDRHQQVPAELRGAGQAQRLCGRAAQTGREHRAGAGGTGGLRPAAGRDLARHQQGDDVRGAAAAGADGGRRAAVSVAAAGGGGIRAADRLRECRESAADAVAGAGAGDCDSHGAGRGAGAADSAAADGGAAACGERRAARAGRRLGLRARIEGADSRRAAHVGDDRSRLAGAGLHARCIPAGGGCCWRGCWRGLRPRSRHRNPISTNC